MQVLSALLETIYEIRTLLRCESPQFTAVTERIFSLDT